jgi:uncharacterized protein (TIGR03067 family)
LPCRRTLKHLLPFLALGLLPSADAQDASKKDQDQRPGDWAPASGERDGQPCPEDVVKARKRSCTGDLVAVRHGDQTLNQGPFTLDPSAKPKAVDVQLEGITRAGVIEVIAGKVRALPVLRAVG